MPSLNQLLSFEYKNDSGSKGYGGPTLYSGVQIPPWSHPKSIAKKILTQVRHTIIAGCMIVGPQGHGKSAVARVLAHHLHTLDPSFQVVWAGKYEFQNQKAFYESLPKRTPHIVIFDDISGALAEKSEKEVAQNFSTITQIRKILDPQKRTPCIVIPIYHYSRDLEKAFRAQFGFSIYTAFGTDEKSNADHIAGKKNYDNQARKALDSYASIIDDMYEKETFYLALGNGQILHYTVDDPLRCVCCIFGTKGRLIVYSEKDCCARCSEKKIGREIDYVELIGKLEGMYGNKGVQGLKICLSRRGFKNALDPKVELAINYLENEIFPRFDFDGNAAVEYLYKRARKKMPDRLYRKKKLEKESTESLNESAKITEIQEND